MSRTASLPDIANLYRVISDPVFGDWSRNTPWVLRQKRYEATFVRVVVDRRQPTLPWPGISPWELDHIKKTWISRPSKPQTALVSIPAHLLGDKLTGDHIAGQLRRADENEQNPRQVPSWDRRRSRR
jgi:hypothetical protein